ncbi:hypothetical protein [Coprococcus ammoniilyticus]|uniref:Uncharacterized protein n=1 Tax=Coprococcus ammoniilyticus TaxID=2981785 RepID=A0ABV1EDZ6_9FIRM
MTKDTIRNWIKNGYNGT